MATFPRHPLKLERPQSGSSHRTSLTPSSSTAARNSTTPPRTPSPHSPHQSSPDFTYKQPNDLLPLIRIDDGDSLDHVDGKGLTRKKSLERTRSWAEEVERNRNHSIRKGKERVKALQSEKSPYGQPFWSVSSEVIDSLVEAISPSTSNLSHLPSAARVIEANRRRSYRIDTDSDEGRSGEDDEWWNEDSYRQQRERDRRITSTTLEVVQPRPRERRKSERSRKSSRVHREGGSSKIPSLNLESYKDSSEKKLSKLSLSTPTTPNTPLTPATPSTPARTPTTPILSIDDIIRKHSPGVMKAENVVKEKARKEIEEVRPRLASMKPRSGNGEYVSERRNKVEEEAESKENPGLDKPIKTAVSKPENLIKAELALEEFPRSRRISFLASSVSSSTQGPSRTYSLPNVKPILRTSQSTHNTPQKSKADSRPNTPLRNGIPKNNNESAETLSEEAKMTSALLDQLEKLEKTSTIASSSSTPSSKRRISFQISPQKPPPPPYSGRPMTPTNTRNNGNGKLSKRKSMPESTLIAVKEQAQAQAESLSYAVYLRSKNLNRTLKIPRSYPEPSLNVSFAEVGNSTGHPVIIFLGLGCVRYLVALFDDIAKTFNLRLICIDRWGFGKTDQIPSERRNPSDWAEVVGKVLDEIGIREFQILAHSAGAPYALATALKFKNRIKGKVHLLAPWVSADIDGGYKWLKYVPNTVIKSATAAEWKLQSYLIGKPPPLKHKPISHNANAPVSSATSSRSSTPLEEHRGSTYYNNKGKRVSLVTSMVDLHTTDKSSQEPRLGRRASNIFSPRSTDHFRGQSGSPDLAANQKELGYLDYKKDTRVISPTPLGNSKFPPQTRSNSENSVTSQNKPQQTVLKAPISSKSHESKSRQSKPSDAPISKELKMNPALTIPNEGFDLPSSSLDSKFITSPVTHSALLRTRSYTFSAIRNDLSPASPLTPTRSLHGSYSDLTSAPTGEGFEIALTQASHAECEPGTTSDLLSIILNRERRPWGFSYTDYHQGIKIYYGSEDDKISEKSMRWMERSLEDVELIIRHGEGHNLMTSPRTMWEIFESLSKDAKAHSKHAEPRRRDA